MSRFRWLELSEGEPPQNTEATWVEKPDLDEGTCLAKGNQFLREGRYESALQWYSRALRFAIELEPAWIGQILCLLSLEENVEANVWADRALERFSDSTDLLAAKACALGRTRGASEAMAYSDASLSVKGKSIGPYPWIVRGELLLNSRNERQNAQRCFNKALELGERDWYTHYQIGLAMMRNGLTEEALIRFSTGAQLDSQNALAQCALGQAQERMGQISAAISAYRKAKAADPRCKLARERLEALGRLGLIRRAWRWLWRRG